MEDVKVGESYRRFHFETWHNPLKEEHMYIMLETPKAYCLFIIN